MTESTTPESSTTRLLVGYGALLWSSALGLSAWLVASGSSVGELWVIGCLAFVAALAERTSVRLTRTIEISISLVPTLFAAVLFGPLAAMIVGAMSNLADLRGTAEARYLKWFIYTGTRALVGGLTGIAAILVKGDGAPGRIALAALLGALLSEMLAVTLSATTVLLRQRRGYAETVRTVAPLVALSVSLYAPVVALLVIAYLNGSPWALPLFLVPALGAQWLLGLYQDQRGLAERLGHANARLARANLSFATALVATVEARDRYTAGHSAAVAIYARDIAREMNLPEYEQRLAYVCGLVHDVGKIGLRAGVLEKPGALTPEERLHMEQHSVIGEHILSKVDDYREIARIVRHHHERFDGQGYPDRLRKDEIPLISRIIAVADAYNAMTSDRPYREAMPNRVARLRLAQSADSQFDRAVVGAFEAVLASAAESYLSGRRADFRVEAQDGYAGLEATAA